MELPRHATKDASSGSADLLDDELLACSGHNCQSALRPITGHLTATKFTPEADTHSCLRNPIAGVEMPTLDHVDRADGFDRA